MSVARARVAAVAAWVLLAAPVAAGAWSPEVNYAINCRGCHLADGSATRDLVPELRGSVGRLVRVPEGRAYLIRLPNVAATPLSDAEVAELLNWVVARFGGDERPADFAGFTAAEVGASRGDMLIDVVAEREAVMAALDAAQGAGGAARAAARAPHE